MSTSQAFLNPWDQQPGEPDQFYVVFCCYLKLGPQRTYRSACEAARAANHDAPNLSCCNRAGYHWHWLDRAAAWDEAHRNPVPTPIHPWHQQHGGPRSQPSPCWILSILIILKNLENLVSCFYGRTTASIRVKNKTGPTAGFVSCIAWGAINLNSRCVH